MGESKDDVISVLTHDHAEVEEMFGELALAIVPADKRRIVDDVTIELVRHSVAEEMYLYPAVSKWVPDGSEIADREIEDHARVERALKELESADAEAPEFDALVRQLITDVTRHVRDEEDNLFPALRKHTSSDELVHLGEKVQSAKKLAPTRPHPSAPDRPPLNKLLAPGAGLVDRVRDHLSHRGSDD